MVSSWDSGRSIGAPGSGEALSASDDPASKRRRLIGPGVFIVWVLASLAWTVWVGADFYYRACDQADMSAEIDRDLNTVACTGPDCTGPAMPAPQEDWTKVATTYLHFGYASIIEWAALPPLGLLAIFVGSSAACRRRRPGPALGKS
jgi:hypothetical protein